MCKCVCVPKKSGKNPKCSSCYPNRPKGKGHDRRKSDEIKANLGKGIRTGAILARFEPLADPQITNFS